MNKKGLIMFALCVSSPSSFAASVDQRLDVLERRADSAGRLVLQIQQLQQQVQQLNGQIEAQAYQIKQLKRQQQDLYRDLDQRISASSSVIAVENNAEPVADKKPESQALVPTVVDVVNEERDYQEAFELLKARQFGAASKAFKQFVQKYPSGKYAENGYYWLGESLYVQGQYDTAAKSFEVLINRFPHGNKLSGALLKLGFIYHQNADWKLARKYLDRVVKEYPGSSTARLASNRLNQMKRDGH
jgi:tol-pal system protein YbgF